MHSIERKHPLRVMISSALCGRVYYLERTMHFDDGIDSAGEHCEMRGIRDVVPPISLWLLTRMLACE
jgi:ABC-type antimicrobial peptide transport system permease subunit